MNNGVIAICDALGFKGIWNQHGNHSVLGKLRGLQSSLQGKSADFERAAGITFRLSLPSWKFDFRAHALSDTFIVFCSANNNKESAPLAERYLMSLPFICLSLIQLIREAARPPICLAYRGCVTVGDCDLDDRFLVGPAVDEAAEFSELSDGSFIWLCPTAQRFIVDPPRSLEDPDLNPGVVAESLRILKTALIEYSIPLKDGRCLQSLVVNPFAHFFDFDDAPNQELDEQIAEQILCRFDSPRLDVVIKKQNTARFLNEAMRSLRQRQKELSAP